jgi:hypothetical protein
MCNAPRHLPPDMASTSVRTQNSCHVIGFSAKAKARELLFSNFFPMRFFFFFLEFTEGDRNFLQTIAHLFPGCDTPAPKAILKGSKGGFLNAVVGFIDT